MYNLTFLSIANRDIQNIVSYYDDINSTLSDVFLKEMEDTKSFILQNPDACPKRIRNISILSVIFVYYLEENYKLQLSNNNKITKI